MSKRQTPSPNRAIGRQADGRFAKGNPGGPGNPHAAAVGAWRNALAGTVTPEDIEQAIAALVAKAKAGEPWAVRELLDRTLGKPKQAVAMEVVATTVDEQLRRIWEDQQEGGDDAR